MPGERLCIPGQQEGDWDPSYGSLSLFPWLTQWQRLGEWAAGLGGSGTVGFCLEPYEGAPHSPPWQLSEYL